MKKTRASRFSFLNEIDSRTLSLFRITLGLALIIDLLYYKAPFIKDFYSSKGIVPPEVLKSLTHTYYSSILYYIHSDAGVYFFFILTFIIYILFTAGYKTKWTSILAYICLISIQFRDYFIIIGADNILRVTLFWSMFLPLNIHYNFFTPGKKKIKVNIKSVAVFAILLQISMIYFFNALGKSGHSWKDGTAVSYSLMVPYLKTSLAPWLMSFPHFCKVLTYLTLLFEFLIPVFIFLPFKNSTGRIIAACSVFFFHWGLIAFLHLEHFAIVTTPFIILLLPPTFWDKLFKNNSDYLQETDYSDSKLKKWILYFLIFLAFTLNLDFTSERLNKIYSSFLQHTGAGFGLNQVWNLFAPDPPRENDYTLVIGRLNDGRLINLYNGEPYDESKINQSVLAHSLPPQPYYYLSVNINIYFVEMNNQEGGKILAESWAKYELLQWNKKHPDQPLKALFIGQIVYFSLAPGVFSEPKTRLLFKLDNK